MQFFPFDGHMPSLKFSRPMRDMFFFANDQFNPQEFNSDTFGDIGQNSSKKWTGNAQTGS